MAPKTTHGVLDLILRETRAAHPSMKCSVAAIAACDEQLLDYLHSGIRVKVYNNALNWTRTGYVGRTTGHSPALILLNRPASLSSWDVLGKHDVLVGVRQPGGQYKLLAGAR